ncbi:hypothetical protein HD806DRAFT_458195 [Xylariaceae sp. AK1471]|nr:hypothetical protein HD806DRAFT_458195 [Xylariaceae sp. AK1471]
MEVVGAIASFIAIGQALAAVPKIIGIVRTVSNFREELQDLIFELEILVARYDHTKETLNLFSPVTGSTQVIFAEEEPYYMKILRTKLESLLQDLNVLARDCQRLSEESQGHLKSFRAAWPWKRQKVLHLYNQARTIQIHMESAARMLMVRTLHTHSRLLSQIHNAVVLDSPTNPPKPADQETKPTSQNLVGDANTSSLVSTLDPASLGTALLVENPHSTCTCSCHQPQAKAGQEINFGLIPGRLSISHSNVTQWLFPCRECKYSLPRVSLRVDYQPPSWLWNRAVLFKASVSALTGINTSLRLPVVWPSHDPIWAALRSPRTEDLLKYISQKSYTATDLDPQGGSVIEYAMAYNQLSIVLVLINRFNVILKDTRAAK